MQLTEQNFLIFAAQNYVNYNCVSNEEFMEDLTRIKYLKKLFTRYRREGEIQDRLIMNHLVVLYNVFNPSALTKILMFKLDKDLDVLLPFLKALNFYPELEGPVPYDKKLDQIIQKSLRSDENV